jgi:hypothetical protein
MEEVLHDHSRWGRDDQLGADQPQGAVPDAEPDAVSSVDLGILARFDQAAPGSRRHQRRALTTSELTTSAN